MAISTQRTVFLSLSALELCWFRGGPGSLERVGSRSESRQLPSAVGAALLPVLHLENDGIFIKGYWGAFREEILDLLQPGINYHK